MIPDHPEASEGGILNSFIAKIRFRRHSYYRETSKVVASAFCCWSPIVADLTDCVDSILDRIAEGSNLDQDQTPRRTTVAPREPGIGPTNAPGIKHCVHIDESLITYHKVYDRVDPSICRSGVLRTTCQLKRRCERPRLYAVNEEHPRSGWP